MRCAGSEEFCTAEEEEEEGLREGFEYPNAFGVFSLCIVVGPNILSFLNCLRSIVFSLGAELQERAWFFFQDLYILRAG